MARDALLEADILYRRNGFVLETRFALRSHWTVLFGPSGAGKTTLLRVIAGLAGAKGEQGARLERGSITLLRRVLLDHQAGIFVPPGIAGPHRQIGFVTQEAALFPHLTARANIAFGLASWERSMREARVEEMLRLFEAQPFAGQHPAALSGGQRQRVALARALAPRPQLLLLDEPFAALDAAARTAMIAALHGCGVPVLYVSHDLADAWQTNADAVVLESGRVVAEGEARIVLAAYREQLLVQLGAASEKKI